MAALNHLVGIFFWAALSLISTVVLAQASGVAPPSITAPTAESPTTSTATTAVTATTAAKPSFFERAQAVTLTTLQLGWVSVQHSAALAVKTTSALYDSVVGWWYSDPSRALTTHQIVRRIKYDGESQFSEWVEDTGYEFSEIKIGSGALPSLGLVFEHARHITETDENELRQRLALHQKQHPDLLSAMERQVIYLLLDADQLSQSSTDLNKVSIQVLPWPGIEISLDPAGAEPTAEDVAAQEAIELSETQVLSNQVNQLQQTVTQLQQQLLELRQHMSALKSAP